MKHYEHWHGARTCPACGRFVSLDRNGDYRRHYVVESGERRYLCVASGTRAPS